MKLEETKAIAKWAKGLFGNVSDEQALHLVECLRPFPKHLAEVVMKNHRNEHDFLNIPQLLTGLRAAMERQRTLGHSREKETVVQWLRRTKPATFHQHMPDEACLLLHFAEGWDAVMQSPAPDTAKSETRRMMLGHAKNAFREIGMSEVDAVDMAHAAIGVVEKQKVVA